MKFHKLNRDEAEKELATAGARIELNQNGITRIEIGDLVIESESSFSALSVSVPEKPKPVERYTVVPRLFPVFETEGDADDFRRKVERGDEPAFEVEKIEEFDLSSDGVD